MYAGWCVARTTITTVAADVKTVANRAVMAAAEVVCQHDQPNSRRTQDGAKTYGERGLRTRRGLRTAHIGTRGCGIAPLTDAVRRTRNERKNKTQTIRKTQKINTLGAVRGGGAGSVAVQESNGTGTPREENGRIDRR